MGSPLDEIGERQDAAIIRCTRAAGYRSSFEPGAAYEVNSENRVGLQRTNSIQTLATFFGWCTVINLVAILIVFVFSNFMHEFFGRVFARTFGVGEMAAKET